MPSTEKTTLRKWYGSTSGTDRVMIHAVILSLPWLVTYASHELLLWLSFVPFVFLSYLHLTHDH
ncbi:hypothetical protein [Caballeronia sp. AZ7_KS35]|uniref:hypothetical protein n=1 Tax=Caballeronia sp. AZ7_KS35 TaxID=2921762 RepID=UPI002029396F|nr:hypothetical protein [Caballeronia sp. AZ7_KS35]